MKKTSLIIVILMAMLGCQQGGGVLSPRNRASYERALTLLDVGTGKGRLFLNLPPEATPTAVQDSLFAGLQKGILENDPHGNYYYRAIIGADSTVVLANLIMDFDSRGLQRTSLVFDARADLFEDLLTMYLDKYRPSLYYRQQGKGSSEAGLYKDGVDIRIFAKPGKIWVTYTAVTTSYNPAGHSNPPGTSLKDHI